MPGTAVNNSPDGAGQKTATFAPLLPGRLRLASIHPKAFGCWLLQACGSAHFWHSIPGNCLVWLTREMEKAFWVVIDKQHAKSFYHYRWESFISPPISLSTLEIILQLRERIIRTTMNWNSSHFICLVVHRMPIQSFGSPLLLIVISHL